jgi:3',5'-cyclic AMP phosphodiesterase CpdA
MTLGLRDRLRAIGIGALLLVGSALSGWAAQVPAAGQSPGEALYFVQITDTHLGSRDHLAVTRRVVDRINDLPYDIACVVHTGDIFADNLADKAVREEGLRVLKRLKAPLHLLPGNHDILEKSLESTLRIYTREVGPLIHQAEYGGVVFLFAYTEPAAMGFTVPGWEPLKAIEGALQGSAGKPVILFHHRPPVDDIYESARYPGWGWEARAAFESLLHAYRVRAVVTGHFHRDELHWLEDIPVFAAPPVAGYWGRQASFRIYRYHEGRLGYQTVYLRD